MKKINASFYEPNFNGNFDEIPISRQALTVNGNLNNINFTINDYNADWHILGTWISNIEELIGKKIIYLQQEPPEIKMPSKTILDNCNVALTFFNIDHPIPQILAPPALQWTYDISAELIKGKGHVYKKVNNDYLTDMLFYEVPKKYKKCSIILSSKQMIEGHKKRIYFADALKSRFKDEIDVFGFGYNPIQNKKDAIAPYYYSIALENKKMENWWTEKIADVFLGHTCPIYYGCSNIENFFDPASFVNIDIDNLDEAIEITGKAIENLNIINMGNIIEARRAILLDFNMLSLISLAINRYENNLIK